MTDTTNPAPVLVTLGGREIAVRCDFGTLARGEEKFAINLLGLNPFKVGLRGVQAVVWASANDAKVTPEMVADWLQDAILSHTFDDVLLAIQQAMFRAYNIGEPKAEEETPNG